MEGAVLICLQSENGSAFASIENQFDEICFFDDADSCFDYLSSVEEETIFLILSRRWTRLVPLLNDFDQVQFIYLNEPCHPQGNSKIRGAFTDPRQLCQQIDKDLKFWKHRQVYLTFVDADIKRLETTITNDLQSRPAHLMWSEMLLNVLLQIPSPPNQPHAEFLEIARTLYARDSSTLHVIDQFEQEYRPSEAIQWYTKDTFVYRLVNKALRTRDIGVIFQFRFLIQDIYRQLKEEQSRTLKRFPLPILLYRGQLMTRAEFDRIGHKSNQYISINTFFSTSTDQKIADIFSGEGPADSDLISVFFEITIDNHDEIKRIHPFADIRHLSEVPDEKEFLLSMGTIMQVTGVTRTDQKMATIHLRLCTYENSVVDEMKLFFSTEIETCHGKTESLINQLGIILFWMGDYDKSQQILSRVKSRTNAFDDVTRSLYQFTARFCQQTLTSDDGGAFIRAMMPSIKSWYTYIKDHPSVPNAVRPMLRFFIDLLLELFKSTAQQTVDSSSIKPSDIELEQNLEHFFSVMKTNIPSSHPSITTMLGLLGLLATRIGEHARAVTFYEQFLAHSQGTMDITHPIRARILIQMAMSCMGINDDQRAQQLIEQLGNYHCLPPSTVLAAFQISIRLHLKHEDWYAALTCYKDILEIPGLPANSLDLVDAYCGIGFIYYRLNLFDQALNALRTALSLQLQHQLGGNEVVDTLREFITLIELKKSIYLFQSHIQN